MARYCSKCNRKFGFFEEDFDGMCKNCYDEVQRQEKIRKQEEVKKRQRQLEEERKKIKEKEENRRREEQKKLEEKRKNEEIKKQKEKLELEEKTKYICTIISKYDNFVIAVANTLEVVSVGLKELLEFGEKLCFDIKTCEGESIYTDLKNKTIDWNTKMFQSVISSLPLQVEYEDVEKLYTLENFKKFVFNFNDTLKIKKENIEQYNILKFSLYKEEILANDFINIEKSLANYNNSLDSIIHSANMSFNYEFAKQCEENKKLNALNFVYSLYVSLIYELLVFDKNIEILKSDEELNTIFKNLIKSQSNKDYIANKLYELCSNLYKDKFIGMQSKKTFEIITTILIKKAISDKLDESIKTYYEITKENEKNIKYEQLSEEINKDVFKTIEIHFLKSISTNIEFEEFIKKICFLFETAKSDYDLAIQKMNERIAEKEKERLLNGDFSKEIEIQKQEVEYSNVQNGYEFEEYVANLYRKLGYTIEKVTKKSGDQRCRCHCI